MTRIPKVAARAPDQNDMANNPQTPLHHDTKEPQSPGSGSNSTVHDILKASSDHGKIDSSDMPTASSQRRKTSIAVDPVALITTECITVTSAMRKHARWAKSSVSAILGGGGSTASRGSSRLTKPNERNPVHQRAQSQASRTGNGSLGEDDGLASRWGLRGKKGQSMQDNPLMSAFARLRNDLRGCTDIQSFDTPSLLHPFLQVIRSSSTSAPITSLAIVAITKFFAYNLVDRHSPRLPLAMQLLSAAITHCRFEASDSAADEIVLLQILQLMESMISGPGGDLLGDESVCEMMETGLSMCCQKRLSELVRRSAEMSMIKMCQIIFERLNALELEVSEDLEVFETGGAGNSNPVMMDPAVNGTTVGSAPLAVNGAVLADAGNLREIRESQQGAPDLVLASEKTSAPIKKLAMREIQTDGGNSHQSLEKPRDSLGPISSSLATASALDLTQHSETNLEETANVTPYSLPSIRELFRVLVDLLQPHNREHSDPLRVMALRIIDVALEVAGPSIAKHPSLANLAKDDLCRYLFQLVRSENMGLLNEALRVAGTLLTTCREVLKLQQELFLSYLVACLHPRVEIPDEPGINPSLYEGVPKTPKLVRPAASQNASGRSTPVPIKERQSLGMEGGKRKPDAREAMIESVGALSRIPSYLVELYVNYDCEVDRSDLCEDLVGLLSRNAFPDSATWSTTNVPPLALDSLLGYVQFVADRLEDNNDTNGYPDIDYLREQRARKRIIIKGATKFNENPKLGIAFLAANGIIDNPDDPKSVAKFLKGTTRISKSVLGDYISKKNNEQLLQAYLDTFEFNDKRVDEALRDLLNSFRLPGESQLIERIVTVFSQKYCANATPEGIADEDAVFTLTYSIIMLNTDQHNPNLKNDKRMTAPDFARNLRGVNGGNDFRPEYLQEIYSSIKTNEIILPDEHDNKKAFDYTWDGLLVKAQTAGSLTICSTNIFDADMFSATWKPIVATLSYVFMSASDDAVFSRVVLGFDQCAQIAAKYGLTDALDHIVYCLSTMSTLASDTPTNTALNTEVQAEKKSIMVSELAVKFGRDYRAQLACAVLFRLIPKKEHSIKDGWEHIVRIWLNLFANSLLPPTFSKSRDLLDIPPIPVQPPNQVIDREQRNTDAGLLSSFTSYLSSYAADDPPEPSEEELESTLCAVDCLASCPMEIIFSRVLEMPTQSRLSLVQALLGHLPEQSSPVVIVVKPDQHRPTPIRTNGHRNPPSTPVYDPSVVFVLEIATIIATCNSDSVALMGSAVADALQNVVRDATNVHPLVLSRAIFYLLTLLHASREHSFVRAPVILHTISQYDQSVLEKSAEPILQGLALCIDENTSLRKEMTNTPDFWLILRSLYSLPQAAANTFDLVENIVGSKPPAVTADNYDDTVKLLNRFAAAGSVGAVVEQHRDRKSADQQRDKRAPKRERSPVKTTTSDAEAVERGHKAVKMIYQLTNRVPGLIEHSLLEKSEAWMTYWSPIFEALLTQCLNPCRKIRHQAFTSLQSALLSPHIASADHQEWTAIFDKVLFPLIRQLLKPEVYQTDPVGMAETKVQAANLLCKIFLHYLVLLSEWDGMLDLWLRILDIMDRLMNSGQGEHLEEAVPESLKNILLVMADGDFLTPPKPGETSPELWDETCKRVDRFLPDLMLELFPQAKVPDSTEQSEPPVASDDPASPPVEGTGESKRATVEDVSEEDAREEPPKIETRADDVE